MPSQLSQPEILPPGYVWRSEAIEQEDDHPSTCLPIFFRKTLVFPMPKPAGWNEMDLKTRMKTKRDYLCQRWGEENFTFEEDDVDNRRHNGRVRVRINDYYGTFEDPSFNTPNFDEQYRISAQLLDQGLKIVGEIQYYEFKTQIEIAESATAVDLRITSLSTTDNTTISASLASEVPPRDVIPAQHNQHAVDHPTQNAPAKKSVSFNDVNGTASLTDRDTSQASKANNDTTISTPKVPSFPAQLHVVAPVAVTAARRAQKQTTTSQTIEVSGLSSSKKVPSKAPTASAGHKRKRGQNDTDNTDDISSVSAPGAPLGSRQNANRTSAAPNKRSRLETSNTHKSHTTQITVSATLNSVSHRARSGDFTGPQPEVITAGTSFQSSHQIPFSQSLQQKAFLHQERPSDHSQPVQHHRRLSHQPSFENIQLYAQAPSYPPTAQQYQIPQNAQEAQHTQLAQSVQGPHRAQPPRYGQPSQYAQATQTPQGMQSSQSPRRQQPLLRRQPEHHAQESQTIHRQQYAHTPQTVLQSPGSGHIQRLGPQQYFRGSQTPVSNPPLPTVPSTHPHGSEPRSAARKKVPSKFRHFVPPQSNHHQPRLCTSYGQGVQQSTCNNASENADYRDKMRHGHEKLIQMGTRTGLDFDQVMEHLFTTLKFRFKGRLDYDQFKGLKQSNKFLAAYNYFLQKLVAEDTLLSAGLKELELYPSETLKRELVNHVHRIGGNMWFSTIEEVTGHIFEHVRSTSVSS